jgi:hypothetical protein
MGSHLHFSQVSRGAGVKNEDPTPLLATKNEGATPLRMGREWCPGRRLEMRLHGVATRWGRTFTFRRWAGVPG